MKLAQLVALIALAGCAPQGTSRDRISRPDTSDCLTVHSADWGHGALEGEVYNACGMTFQNAAVEFTLFDSSGAQVGSVNATTSNLATGIWKFRAVAKRSHEFKLVKVIGYK